MEFSHIKFERINEDAIKALVNSTRDNRRIAILVEGLVASMEWKTDYADRYFPISRCLDVGFIATKAVPISSFIEENEALRQNNEDLRKENEELKAKLQKVKAAYDFLRNF